MIENNCPICGHPIPERPRGSRHGHPPKTCSERCRKLRAALRERERYQKVKGTPAYKEVRAAYVTQLRRKLAEDPEFAAVYRFASKERTRAWRAKLREADPARHAQMKVVARAERQAWRQRLVSDPQAWDQYRAKCRAWYAALSADEKDRIFNAPRRRARGSGAAK